MEDVVTKESEISVLDLGEDASALALAERVGGPRAPAPAPTLADRAGEPRARPAPPNHRYNRMKPTTEVRDLDRLWAKFLCLHAMERKQCV